MDGKLGTYQTVDLIGQTQLELILTVYRGAIDNYRAAADLYKTENYQAGHEKMDKANKFVTHLYTTLDPDEGGEVADHLGKLYAFILNQTNVARATKDLGMIDDIISVLDNLRLGWTGLKEQQKKSKRPAAPTDLAPGSDNFSTTA
jgi:flagellar protein FliS